MPDIERAAEVIRSCCREKTVIDYVKGTLWPDTVEEGYAVQSLVAKLRKEPVIGWKIAATAEAGRQHINVDRPMAGRLFSSICHSGGDVVAFGNNRMAVAEAEFAFTLGRDLPPRQTPYTPDEVSQCITTLHAGLELPDSRFKDFTLPGTAGLIADNACACDFVLGPATTEPFDPAQLRDQRTRLLVNDVVVSEGKGSDVLEGPLDAMVWMANTLSKLKIGLTAGQFVTTGVTGKPTPVKPGDLVCADLGVYGSVNVELAV